MGETLLGMLVLGDTELQCEYIARASSVERRFGKDHSRAAKSGLPVQRRKFHFRISEFQITERTDQRNSLNSDSQFPGREAAKSERN